MFSFLLDHDNESLPALASLITRLASRQPCESWGQCCPGGRRLRLSGCSGLGPGLTANSLCNPYGRQHCTGTSTESERPGYVSQCYFFLALWLWTNYLYCLSSSFGKMRITFWGLSEVIDVKSQAGLNSQSMVGCFPVSLSHVWTPGEPIPCHAVLSASKSCSVTKSSKFFIPRGS